MLSNFLKLFTLFSTVIIVGISFVSAQSPNLSTKISVKVTPSAQNINPGQSATVKIETASAIKCTITGKPYNNFDIIRNGNILLRPTETTEYVFNCTGPNNSTASTKAKITVVPTTVGTQSVTPRTTGATAGTGSSRATGSAGSAGSGGSAGGQTAQQPRQQTQYSNQSITSTANELCARYSGYSSVYDPTTAGGGGSSVPVNLAELTPYLVAIDRSNLLIANELRQDNLLKYCTEYQNMARATSRLAETAAKTIKTIADNCYADKQCMLERRFKASLEQEIKKAYADEVYGQQIGELVQSIQDPKPIAKAADDAEKQAYCNEMYELNLYPKECILVPKAFDVIVEKYYLARENIERAQNDTLAAFGQNDVMGARPCVETASGRSPEEVRFYEPDCTRYRQEPSLVNQEALRQITALPYTQAFSPSSVLGFDGVLDNINTRTRDGNLVDPNISPTFGSSNGPAGGTATGGVNTGSDLKGIEDNYKKISTNIGVIVQLYDVARLAYASSTSVCKSLPITTRRTAVEKIDSNKKTYVDYLTELKRLWDAAVAAPRENHSNLITKVNFDLKDRYGQDEINKVYDAVKKLLQTCVDANSPSS